MPARRQLVKTSDRYSGCDNLGDVAKHSCSTTTRIEAAESRPGGKMGLAAEGNEALAKKRAGVQSDKLSVRKQRFQDWRKEWLVKYGKCKTLQAIVKASNWHTMYTKETKANQQEQARKMLAKRWGSESTKQGYGKN